MTKYNTLQNMPKDVTENVYILGPKDKKEAVEVLATSFGGYQGGTPELMVDWLVGADFKKGPLYEPLEILWNNNIDSSRQSLLRYIFNYSCTTTLRYGTMLGIKDENDKLAAVLCFSPPGAKATFWDYAMTICQVGIMPFLRTGPQWSACLQRLQKVEEWTIKNHKTHLTNETYYISYVGVHPCHQGKKYGKQLMMAMNGIADRDSAPIFLECSGAKNVEIYKKYGYEVVDECSTIGESLKEKGLEPFAYSGYGMVRPPQT
jgi:ribosomal protein S18 acetylase RimI-like enzyme